MRTLAFFCATLTLATGVAWAQIAGIDSSGTGTITGVVIDGETKEPLPGAIVTIIGTAYCANTDINGRFVITDIPVGAYDLSFKMKGYNCRKEKNVMIKEQSESIFAILQYNIETSASDCTAEPPRMRYQETGAYRVIDYGWIESVPATSVSELLEASPGNPAIKEKSRVLPNMIMFYDSYEITDPHFGSMPELISLNCVGEINLRSIGFPVVAGHSLSGIVSILPQDVSGSCRTKYIMDWRGDGLFTEKDPDLGRLRGRFWGASRFLKGLSFLVSGEVSRQQGEKVCCPSHRAFTRDKGGDYFWADTLRHSQSIWCDSASSWVYGWMDSTEQSWESEKTRRLKNGQRRGWREEEATRLPHTDKASGNIHGKLGYKIPDVKAFIEVLGVYNRAQHSLYSAAWKYNADQYYAHADKSWLLGGKMTHQPTRELFYNVAINKYRISKQTGVRDTAAERGRDWWEDYVFVPDIDLDGDNIYDGYDVNWGDYSSTDNPYGVPGIFASRGMPRVWRKTSYSNNCLSGNLVWQANHYNLLKFGFDYKDHQAYLKENTLPWHSEAFKDYYNARPRTFGAYAQDQLEHEGIIMQVGLRWDYLDPNVKIKMDYFSLVDTPPKRPAKTQQCLSPRLGFSWPVSERTVYRANFGRYAQQPLFHHMYQNLDADWLSSTHVIGNPELKHQKATIYEAGFDRQTGPYTLSGSLYYKERTDLVGLTAFGSDWLGGDAVYYYQYQNNGQSTTRGLELCLRKDYGKSGLRGEASYTFQNTSYSLNPTTVMHRAQWLYYLGADPFTGFPMENYQEDHPPDWDLRHKIVLISNYRTWAGDGPVVWGRWPFSNVNIFLVNLVKSGLPYTRIGLDGTVRGGLNRGRLPWTWNTDLKIEKRLKVWKSEGSLALEILNLFDRRNISGVYPQTGSPDWMNPPLDRRAFGDSSIVDSLPGPVNAFGDTVFIPNADYNQRRDLNGDGEVDADEMYGTYLAAWEDFVSDPRNGLRTPNPSAYQPPRSVRLTLGVKF